MKTNFQNRVSGDSHANARLRAALTLPDLLVLVSIVLFGGFVIATASGRPQSGSRAFQCLQNARRLIEAWQMYAEDNDHKLAPNRHGSALMGGSAVSWAQGWLDFATSPDNTNTLLLVDKKYALLAPYINKDPDIFHCP